MKSFFKDFNNIKFLSDNSESFFRLLFDDIEREMFVHDIRHSSNFKYSL